MPVQVTGRYEKIWKPHAKQVEFIQIPFSIFEAMYGGAAGGGKSELLLMLPILYGLHDVPQFNGILFRRTFPQLEESLIRRSWDFYSPLGGRYDPQKHVWTFPSRAQIRFSYLDRDEDARDHDTAEYHYAGFDELTAFTEFMYRYITSRVRSSIPGVPAIVRTATNPGNIGHKWVRDRFVAPAPNGGIVIYDLDTKQRRIFIQAKLTDNPFLMEHDPEYINRLRILPEAEQKAKIDGDWWTFSGMVFTEWRERVMGGDPPNACHVCPTFEIPFWWPKVLGLDWGYSQALWAGWAAVAPSSRVYLYREYVTHKTNIAVWGADIARITEKEKENLVAAVLDPSAWQKRGEEKTIAAQIIEATGINFEKADNDRIGGKMLMHEFLRWQPRPSKRIVDVEAYDEEMARRILRNGGTSAYEAYRQSFIPEPPELNLPRLQVFPQCREFIKAIPMCSYEQKDGQNTEDVATWRGTEEDPVGDDPYDGGRYLLKAVDRYLWQARKEHQKRQKLANIYETLEETRDWNRFYRQMALVEKGSSRSPGVHRGRRRGVHFVARPS